MERLLAAPAQEGQIGLGLPVVPEFLHGGGAQVEPRQSVRQPSADLLAALELPSQGRHGAVGGQREGRAQAREPREVRPRRPFDSGPHECRAGERVSERAERVRDHEAQMREERAVEFLEVARSDRFHLRPDVGVAADRALAEDDEGTRQNVRALDRDPDRHRRVGVRQNVPRSLRDSRARLDVHGGIHHRPHPLGEVRLHDRGDHGRLLPGVHGPRRQHARPRHDVGHAADLRERLLDPLEAPDGKIELLAHGPVRARHARAELRGAGGQARKGDPTPRGEVGHEHLPALPHPRPPADDGVQRHEDVASVDRAVEKGHPQRIVPLADLDPGKVGRDERERDAEIFLVAQEVVGIVEAEREPDEGRHRRERDVALPELELHAQDVLALVGAVADDAAALRGSGVASRFGPGEREARNLFRGREPREVVALLLLRAVVEEKLRGTERIRNHHRDRGSHAPARELGHDRRVGEGGESQPAVLLRNDHPEEPVLLDEPPCLGREIAVPLHLPLLDHPAQLFHGAVEKRALARAQGLALELEELLPSGPAREELAVPPDRARLEGDALRIPHAREGPSHGTHDERREEPAPHGRDCEDREHSRDGEDQHDRKDGHFTRLLSGARAGARDPGFRTRIT